MEDSGLIGIIPLLCTVNNSDKYPVFLHPESPHDAKLGAVAVANNLNGR